ncbi:MAG: OmpA family protein [Candidatus Kapabacteria bacterium]|nr:OmpA family protein [Candidatus Kapabacteria bacterium]
MKNIILILSLFVISTSVLNAQKSLNLRADITPELVKEYDAYIRKYAPADSAYNVILAWANQHFAQKRAAVSAYLFEVYKPLFPNLYTLFDSNINKMNQIMLTQTASQDMFSIYTAYIRSNAPTDAAFFCVQRIADFYVWRQDWDSAAYVYNTFRKLFPDSDKKFQKIIDLLLAPKEGLEITNLGPNINTAGSEWDPTSTPDGRYLYFTADYRLNGNGGADIWVSEKKEGEWQKSVNIGKPLNGFRDETVDNVTVDGTGLLISGNFQGSYGQYDIYLAEKDSAGWKDILHYPEPINTEYHNESGCLSPDSRAILFTSDRPGEIGPYIPINSDFYGGSTMGNMDIYVSIESDSGWSRPINLGPTINTPYAERAAYLHPDGRTLYFSSNGHYGLGRLDVFKSVRLSDTSWTEWSEPVNLGKEINTSQDDWGYVVDLEGKAAYFAKENDNNSYGNWDIYSISLPKSAKPQSIVVIKGRVADSLGRAIACNIVWEDLSTGKQVGHLKSDPRDGYYFITLPPGKNYGYYASTPGFYPSSKNIDLRDINQNKEITENIVLVSIQDMKDKGSRVRINNIFFDTDKYLLKDESIPELNRLLAFVERIPQFRIIIEGHTDNTGTDTYNLKLSNDRAGAVAEFLTSKGISPDRIISEGYGSSKPAAPNTTDENKALNRRVEIRLTR